LIVLIVPVALRQWRGSESGAEISWSLSSSIYLDSIW